MNDYALDPESAEFTLRQSWEIHTQAFGPILEPAFAENLPVRILLIGALNHISRREIQRGLEILKEIQPHCVYDEDRAAWAFFVGLCFEMAGAREKMLQWYAQAGKIGHRFYLPYLKLAKAAHGSGQYKAARAYYETAIACLLEMPEKDLDPTILGSAYINLTICLTTLHRYADGVKAWRAAQCYPLPPGAFATAAVLFAAMGDLETAAAYLEKEKDTAPAAVAQAQEAIRRIPGGEWA